MTNGPDQNISAYSIGADGTLSAVDGSPFAVGVAVNSVAAQAAGKYVYVVDSNGISGYTINPTDGMLSVIAGSSLSTGAQPAALAIDPTGQFIYVANAGSNNISEYKIDSATGALSAISFSPVAANANPTGIVADPTGRFVYVANGASIQAYAIYAPTGALNELPGSPFSVGSLPVQLTVDPTGRFLLAALQSSLVSAFTINPATGALTVVSDSPFATQSAPSSVAVDPTGRFVYVANRGSNNVSAYMIDPISGALTPIAGSPFASGNGPTAVVVDPTAHFAYVTNGLDGNISAYAIASTTGALSPLAGSPFSAGSGPTGAAIAITNGPTLGVAKSHVGSFTQGQSGVTYTVTASNTGVGPTTGSVTVTELAPSGLTLTGMAGSGWNCPTGGVICTRTDSLAHGMSYAPITVSMNVAGNAPASVNNVVTVSGVGSLSSSASDAATVAQLPILTVSSSHVGTFYQGEVGATYAITVSNSGPGATVGTATVTETVPAGLVLVSLGGIGWTCAHDGNSCTRSDALAPGASYPVITATVNVASTASESVTNQVSVSGGGSASASSSDQTIIPQPMLTVAKSHTGDFIQGQDGATYSIVVGNGSLIQPPLLVNTTSVTIGRSSCNNSQHITVMPAGGSPVVFTVAVNYPDGSPSGDTNGNWLYATIPGIGTTSTGTRFNASTALSGVTLTIGLNRTISASADTAQVILTPTDPGSLPVTITVNYAQTASCGTNTGSITNGFVTITPAALALTAPAGGQQSQTIFIQNTTANAMTFSYSVSPGWLSAQANTTAIAANGTATINLVANTAATTGAGVYTDSLIVSPQSGFGTPIVIPVQFTVTAGGASRTLTVGGGANDTYTTAFSYVAPILPGSQCASIQDTAPGANSYATQVTTSSGGNWLLANNSINGTTIQLLAPQYGACVLLSLSNVVATLTSGVYQGQVAITSSSGATATISVNLYVSTGIASGITVTPGLIFVFPNAAVNSSVVQTQSFSVTAVPGYTIGNSTLTNGGQGFSMSSPVASNNSLTFSVTSNPAGLPAGVYSTTVTIPSSFNGGNASISTITIVLPVGQVDQAPGAPVSPTMVGPAALSFQHQHGNTFWTSSRETQTITIAGSQGMQWSASIVYGSGSNWLNIDSSSSGTLGSVPATLFVDLFNGVTNLAPSSTPYQAVVVILTPSGSYSIPVTLLVTPATTPVLLGLPASSTFVTSMGINPASETVEIEGSDNPTSATNPPIIAGTPIASWLRAVTSGNILSLTVDSTQLSAAVYSATVTVSASAYSNPINYPVTLVVEPLSFETTGSLTLSATSLSFANVTTQTSQTLNVSATGSTQFSAASTETTCTGSPWLQVSGGNYMASSSPIQLTVTVDPTDIANGTTCAGAIRLISGTTQVVTVAMTVGTPGTGIVATTGTVTITELPPNGMTIVSMAGTGWNCKPNGLQCSRSDSLAEGTTYPPIAVTVNVATAAPSSLTNQVIASGGGSASATASDPTTIATLPSLSVTATHAGNFVQGQTGATYSLMVSNGAASVPTSATVTVNEIVPAGLTLVSMSGTGWTCPPNGTSCYRADPLPPGSSYDPITVTVNVAKNASTSLSNHVNVSYGAWTSSNVGDPTTILSACALTNDGTASTADVQQAIRRALGAAQTGNDLNLDGVVNSVDVQIVINATLQLGCSL